jgi:membrane protein implicated in regulation of membrane protease activity
MRTALLVIGILALLMGLVWVGQGTGYFPYPKESFMISQMPWAYRGAALAAVGLVLIVLSRRR